MGVDFNILEWNDDWWDARIAVVACAAGLSRSVGIFLFNVWVLRVVLGKMKSGSEKIPVGSENGVCVYIY